MLTGIVVVVSLVIAARLVERLLRALLVRLRFDSLLVLPRLAYFLLLFLFARTAADAFGLTAISEAIASMFSYLPNVLAAVRVVVVGTCE